MHKIVQGSTSRLTYVTICTNSNYTRGVLLLGKSLEKVKAQYPLLCVCSDTYEDIEILRRNKIKTKIIKNTFTMDKSVQNENIKTGYSHWNQTMFKLNIFGLIEYEKIVYLDSDMIVLNNIDQLFDMPHMTGVCAGKLWMKHWRLINTGLMVIEPNIELFHKMQDLFTKSKIKFPGDEIVIQTFYSDWDNQKELQLTEHYNLLYHLANRYSKYYGYVFEDIKVVHYVGFYKPWMKKPLKQKIVKFLKYIRDLKYLGYRITPKIDKYFQQLNMEIE